MREKLAAATLVEEEGRTELELALLAVILAEALEEERAESGTGSSTERVEDEESCVHRRQDLCMLQTRGRTNPGDQSTRPRGGGGGQGRCR